ncbi:hypothetical protein NPIL_424851 [Nephila pilipes]|uniref:C2H2-type domain-containing protein n=1 Tax=Nephila pilipes TaxID=299642 RepID=A0A8X6NB64_NEPPI|nr:hypothetical protein NPIL_424851 [Nephila pilipes]
MQAVEDIFENSDFSFNTQILTTSDCGDLTSSQLDSPFEDEDDKKLYDCLTCHNSFKYPKNLKRHEKNVHGNIQYNFEHCEKTFSRSDIFKRHVKLHEISRRNKQITEETKDKYLILLLNLVHRYIKHLLLKKAEITQEFVLV